MNSLVTGLRDIILHRGRSVTRTVAVTVTSKRDIHRDQITFKHPEHVNTPEKQEEALKAVVEFAAISGLDAAGAVSADISGGFHPSETGTDKFWRLTATIWDKNKNQMYFHRQVDNTWWDRIHIPRKTAANEEIWKKTNEYAEKGTHEFLRVTKKQFATKKL